MYVIRPEAEAKPQFKYRTLKNFLLLSQISLWRRKVFLIFQAKTCQNGSRMLPLFWFICVWTLAFHAAAKSTRFVRKLPRSRSGTRTHLSMIRFKAHHISNMFSISFAYGKGAQELRSKVELKQLICLLIGLLWSEFERGRRVQRTEFVFTHTRQRRKIIFNFRI